MRIDSNSIFLDTSPFIYLIENNTKYCSLVANYLANKSMREIPLITSVITIAEFQVNPKKLNIFKPIEDFNKLLFHFNIKVVDINADIAEISATLRAKYQSIKGMDAIQIASAINEQCKSFVTNDLRLKQVEEIEIITINELKES